MIRRAMVLAAGRGTRLAPLTDTLPKPLMPVAGRPLLAHILDFLRAGGIDDVVVNLHHLGHLIEREIGDGSAFGMRVRYSREDPLLLDTGEPRNAPAAHMHNLLGFDGVPPAELRATARAQLGEYPNVEPRDVGVEVRDETLYPTDLETAEEVFITSTTRELSPVVRIDGKTVGTGKPGPLWTRMTESFNALRERLAGTPAL